MRESYRKVIIRADFLLVLVVYPAAWILRKLRVAGVEKFPRCRAALLKMGVFPVSSHYYEPQFDFSKLAKPLSAKRNLPAISWNMDEQLSLLSTLIYANELEGLNTEKVNDHTFFLENKFFEHGDAEYWYQLIRAKKPNRILEVGSGYSTLIALMALQKNEEEGFTCEHVCIEPFEVPWLETKNVSVVRKKVEEVPLSFFEKLESGDILFIDSSHIIRPEGDVLFEYLEVLPCLQKGVIVHVHDIFSPRNYPEYWLVDRVRFWNEQYLLEAFLSNNDGWEIIAALNHLHHENTKELAEVCPFLGPDVEPKSFYIRKKH